MAYSFLNDYSEGAHPNILKALETTNLIQENGYGNDSYCLKAAELIKSEIQNPEAEVFFISGGTQANLLVISALLRPYEAVISADTGHIAGHEAGAIEATGHKVITTPGENGKLTPRQIENALEHYHLGPHVVKPKMVYISNATELGTVYSSEDLKELYTFCQHKDLLLFMDGARLGVALTSKDNNLSFQDIGKYTDVFYIGGTKNGALLGEAVVFNNINLSEGFDYNIKQKGAMLAKGRVLGVQFSELFQNDLFFDLARQANETAQYLARGLKALNIPFLLDSPTNQIFPIFSHKAINELHKTYSFHEWLKRDDQNSAVRLVTSWATKKEDIDEFIETVKKL